LIDDEKQPIKKTEDDIFFEKQQDDWAELESV